MRPFCSHGKEWGEGRGFCRGSPQGAFKLVEYLLSVHRGEFAEHKPAPSDSMSVHEYVPIAHPASSVEVGAPDFTEPPPCIVPQVPIGSLVFGWPCYRKVDSGSLHAQPCLNFRVDGSQARPVDASVMCGGCIGERAFREFLVSSPVQAGGVDGREDGARRPADNAMQEDSSR